MSAKHTPGPWRYVGKTKRGQPLAYCVKIDAWTIYARTEANARLIAAAPDLLAFARLVAALETNGETEARTGDQQSGDDAVEALSNLIGLARAAITKAEGR